MNTKKSKSVKHTNRKGQTYYLHHSQTKTGKSKYFFSLKNEGDLVNTVPVGWEIYENPNSQVFLRKIQPKIITDEELNVVKKGMEQYSQVEYYIIDDKAKIITIYTTDQNVDALVEILGQFSLGTSSKIKEIATNVLSYSPMMRFILIDEKLRIFQTERYCFRGSIDDWISIGLPNKLENVVKEFVRHLGQDSYYELF